MTSITQEFKFFLKKSMGLEKTFRGSQIERKTNGLNGFEIFFSHFSTEFWFSPTFVVVYIVLRLIVISY